MKNLRNITNTLKSGQLKEDALQQMLWQLICYSPKFPDRLHQVALLEKATKFTFPVFDQYFDQKNLNTTYYRWGNGPHKILLTHGWGSKALDFVELISQLLKDNTYEIWSFDAPGNGSSEGELSNLILYTEAIREFQLQIGDPEVMIGHSLGGMANYIATHQLGLKPKALVSIAPLINLTANFRAAMTAVNISEGDQLAFLAQFEKVYDKKTDDFNIDSLDVNLTSSPHLLIYATDDPISPVNYLNRFIKRNPLMTTSAFDDSGHAKLISDHRVIAQIMSFISV